MKRGVIEWTCDRCGRQELVPVAPSPEGNPLGWSEVTVAPMHPDEIGTDTPKLICPGCTNQVGRFLMNKDDVPPAVAVA